MRDDQTLEAAADSDAPSLFVRHAATIADAKALVESQLEAAEWWGTEDEWEASFGDDSIYSGAVGAAADVARVSAPEAANGGKDMDAAVPLLIKLDSHSTFPLDEWRPRVLAEQHAGLQLRLNGCTDEGDAVTVPCRVFLEYLQEQDSYHRCRKTAEGEENLDIFTLCIFDSRVLDPRHATTDLADHYRAPDAPSMGLVDGGGRLLERLEPVLRPDTRWLLLGPARSGTAIHKDPRNTAAWNTVCSGVKRWALLSPEVSAPLAERESPPEGTKWTIPDWFREEWPSIAAEAVEKGGIALDFLQREGETVVVPKGWWHAVVNVRSSVAITENFVAADTLQSAIDGAATVEHPTTREQEVVTAVVDCLGLVDEDAQGEAGGVWRWIRGMHDDGLICLPQEALEQPVVLAANI